VDQSPPSLLNHLREHPRVAEAWQQEMPCFHYDSQKGKFGAWQACSPPRLLRRAWLLRTATSCPIAHPCEEASPRGSSTSVEKGRFPDDHAAKDAALFQPGMKSEPSRLDSCSTTSASAYSSRHPLRYEARLVRLIDKREWMSMPSGRA
jgi:hypothetical protein